MAHAKQSTPALNLDQFFRPTDQTADLDFLLGAEPEATAQRARERNLPLLDLPVHAIAPDAQQVRRLPHPNDLLHLEATGDRAAAAILAGLRELGQSMVEHGQVQRGPFLALGRRDAKADRCDAAAAPVRRERATGGAF